MISNRSIKIVRIASFILALIPFALLFYKGLTDDLGANPVEFLTRSTGDWTLRFLLITLCITPLRKISGWHWLLRLRRMLGLFTYFYACLHFSIYILDQFFSVESILEDIIERPYITVGFSCFVLLTSLAMTSNNAMIRKLGARRWQALHRLVYVIGIGAILHFLWLVKKDHTEPLIYGFILALLLLYRLLARYRRPDTMGQTQ